VTGVQTCALPIWTDVVPHPIVSTSTYLTADLRMSSD
jgi:hypothetical protein